MNKCPIAIVLFNPPKISIERILKYKDLGIDFYVFDNSKSKNEILFNHKGIKYYHDGKNHGLSHCINFLAKKILNDNFDKFLFFDQDTIFTKETLVFIDSYIAFQTSTKDSFFDSVLAVNFRDDVNYNHLNIIKTKKIGSYLLNSVYFNINSGTLYLLKYYQEFKWFDYRFFVDGVDYDFSLNVISNNYKNISINCVPGLNHFDEQGYDCISFFGKKITSRLYPLSRNLDFIRSHFLILFKCFKLMKIKPIIFISRAILTYILTQLLFRISSSLKNS